MEKWSDHIITQSRDFEILRDLLIFYIETTPGAVCIYDTYEVIQVYIYTSARSDACIIVLASVPKEGTLDRIRQGISEVKPPCFFPRRDTQVLGAWFNGHCRAGAAGN